MEVVAESILSAGMGIIDDRIVVEGFLSAGVIIEYSRCLWRQRAHNLMT